jgi:hypothetical protein
MRKIIGLARTIDFSDDGTTCRVRLYGEDGLPTGKVLTDILLLSEKASTAVSLPKLSDHELDTAARQNLYYNSHQPVAIE